MFRQLLLALVVCVGAGVSVAQSPVTYSEAAAEVVSSIEGLGTLRVEGVIEAHNQCSPSFWWVPAENVSWVTTENVEYSGTWRNECNQHLVAANVLRFYEGYCETQNRSHCGRLKRGNLPWEMETEAVTGTSLDDWNNFEVPDEWTMGFPFQSAYALGPGLFPHEFTCVGSSGAQYWWSSFSVPHDYLPDTLTYYVMRYDGSQWFLLHSSSPTIGVFATTVGVDIESKCKAARSGDAVPNIRDWREGSYFNRAVGVLAEAAEPHPDAVDGLKVIWAELLAENDRIQQAGLAIAGMSFNPVPTAEELNQGEGAVGEPGEGWDVDPGSCEDGWVLTQVVCHIRQLVENTWQFLSHDAWVPETDWGEEFATLRETAEGRFPFNVGNAFVFLYGDWEQSEELMCADIEVVVPNPIGDGGQSVGDVNLCDNALGAAAHGYFRPVLVLWLALMLLVSLYNRTLGSL